MPQRHPSTIGAQVGNAAYWVVLLIAVFLAAQPLGLASATGPIGQMLNGVGEAVPRIVGAGLILFFGYVIAGVARKAVAALISASRIEKLTDSVGARAPDDPTLLPRAVGGTVFALIIFPVAIAALDTLNIAAISQPATAMLQVVLDAIPRIIAAGIILALAYAIGKFASRLLATFLASTGFDRTINSLGLFPQVPTIQTTTVDPVIGEEQAVFQTANAPIVPSKAVGTAVFAAIVIFGMMEAFRQLNFAYGSRIMAEIPTLLGQVVFGSIINLAFGLILGAIAIAGALAFGLGGREPAGRFVSRMLGKAEAQIDAPKAKTPPTGP